MKEKAKMFQEHSVEVQRLQQEIVDKTSHNRTLSLLFQIQNNLNGDDKLMDISSNKGNIDDMLGKMTTHK